MDPSISDTPEQYQYAAMEYTQPFRERYYYVQMDMNVVIWDYKNSPFLSSFNPLATKRADQELISFISIGVHKINSG